MLERRSKIWILLCGILVFTATSLCHAQDPGKLFDIKTPQAKISSSSILDITNTSPPRAAEAKPDKGFSEQPWYWRFLKWLAIDVARYNTEKQSDGRPLPLGNSR